MEHTCKHYGVHFVNYESMLHHVDVNRPLNTSQSCGELQHTSDESTRTHDATLVDNNKKELQSDKKRFHFRKSALDNTVNETSIIPQTNMTFYNFWQMRKMMLKKNCLYNDQNSVVLNGI